MQEEKLYYKKERPKETPDIAKEQSDVNNKKEYDIEKLYTTYYPKVVNYFDFKYEQANTVDDMFQDALRIFIEKSREPDFKLNSNVSPGTYIFAIVKNKWLAEYGKNKIYIKKKYRLSPEDKQIIEDLRPKFTNQFDANQMKEEANIEMETEQYHRFLKKYIQTLLEDASNTCGKIITAKFYNNYTTEEIAEELQYTNLKSVKSTLHRCLKQLKTAALRLPKFTDYFKN